MSGTRGAETQESGKQIPMNQQGNKYKGNNKPYTSGHNKSKSK